MEEDVKILKFLSGKYQVTQLTNTFWMKIAVGNRRCRPCALSIQACETLSGPVMIPPVKSFQNLCYRTNILSQLSRQSYLCSHWRLWGTNPARQLSLCQASDLRPLVLPCLNSLNQKELYVSWMFQKQQDLFFFSIKFLFKFLIINIHCNISFSSRI